MKKTILYLGMILCMMLMPVMAEDTKFYLEPQDNKKQQNQDTNLYTDDDEQNDEYGEYFNLDKQACINGFEMFKYYRENCRTSDRDEQNCSYYFPFYKEFVLNCTKDKYRPDTQESRCDHYRTDYDYFARSCVYFSVDGDQPQDCAQRYDNYNYYKKYCEDMDDEDIAFYDEQGWYDDQGNYTYENTTCKSYFDAYQYYDDYCKDGAGNSSICKGYYEKYLHYQRYCKQAGSDYQSFDKIDKRCVNYYDEYENYNNTCKYDDKDTWECKQDYEEYNYWKSYCKYYGSYSQYNRYTSDSNCKRYFEDYMFYDKYCEDYYPNNATCRKYYDEQKYYKNYCMGEKPKTDQDELKCDAKYPDYSFYVSSCSYFGFSNTNSKECKDAYDNYKYYEKYCRGRTKYNSSALNISQPWQYAPGYNPVIARASNKSGQSFFGHYPADITKAEYITLGSGKKAIRYKGDIDTFIEIISPSDLIKIMEFVKNVGYFKFFKFSYYWEDYVDDLDDGYLDLTYLYKEKLLYPIVGVYTQSSMILFIYKDNLLPEDKIEIGNIYMGEDFTVTKMDNWYITSLHFTKNTGGFAYTKTTYINLLIKLYSLYDVVNYQIGQNPLDRYDLDGFSNDFVQMELASRDNFIGMIISLEQDYSLQSPTSAGTTDSEFAWDEEMVNNVYELNKAIQNFYRMTGALPNNLGSLHPGFFDITKLNIYGHKFKYNQKSLICYEIGFKPLSAGFQYSHKYELDADGYWFTKFCTR